jgi:PAS domain S-box-containing protein
MHRSRRRADRQRESLRITLSSIGDAVITTDAEGRVATLNPVAVSLTGWTQPEALGRPVEEIFHIVNEQSRQRVQDPVKKVLSEGKAVGLANHTVLLAKDGTERPIDDSAAAIRDRDGNIRGVVLVFRDITERRRAEKSRALLASIFESSDDAILSKDLQGIITSWNGGAERLYGYRAEEVVGQPVSLLMPPELPDEFPSIMERLKRDERIDHYETMRVRKDGSRVAVSLTVSPVKSPDGRVTGASAVARDISERLRLIEELREHDRRKDEFLATLAHELRNPLAPIRNGLQILRLASDDKHAIEQARTVMERQVQQAVRIIDDLLDVSRIARNKLRLHQERIDLAKVVQHAVEISRPQIEAAGHELSLNLPSEPIYVHADAARLAQVFSNLLNNAAKYTEPGGRIGITLLRQNGTSVVTVKDTGIGIPAEHLPHVFEMFVQFDRSLERSQGGLGIGLTLSKRLVEMHGGEIEAHSDGPKQGSEFVVRLPALSAPPADKPATAPCEGQPASGQCKVLVVDDNQDAAESLRILLRIMGHHVITANDGEKALELVASYKPDLVLLDISLPKVDGYEVARRIRQSNIGPDVKIIALTGWGQEEDKRRSKQAGFDEHLVKPVEPAVLEELLLRLCPAPA